MECATATTALSASLLSQSHNQLEQTLTRLLAFNVQHQHYPPFITFKKNKSSPLPIMSTDATAPTSSAPAGAAPVAPTSAAAAAVTSPSSKGKGKSTEAPVEEDDDDEEESDEEEDDDEDEDVMEEDVEDEVDPSLILPGPRRSTRGVRVDYSSAAALAKAGLKPEDLEEDEEQEKSFAAPDDRMEE